MFCVCGLLAAAVAVAFLPALRMPFLHFDDDIYVWAEPHVANGFTAESWAWAWTHNHAANWHPLTTLSHMLDCQLFGLRPWGHHLVNLILHAATAMLVFLACKQMTGRFWASAALAAVFAVHPLRVESVVWVAERKDLLCGLFFWLTLAAYVYYARLPFSGLRYGVVVFCFALALLAKPMAVSLPLVMLLLDYWPLYRVGQVRAANAGPPLPHSIRWWLEKLPLLVMSGLLCYKTLQVQDETVRLNASIPLALRASNALMSCQAYLLRTFWPAGLAGHYPFPRQPASLPAVCAAAGLLLAVTVLAVALRRTRPYLLAGWFWYLGMLVPVIGLVQVGRQAMADRYTYLPQIGLLWMIVFAAADLLTGWHALSFKRRAWIPEKSRPSLEAQGRATPASGTPAQGRATLACLAALLLAVLTVATWRQTGFWRDDFAFMQRALECNEDDPDMHNNMAAAFIDKAGLEADRDRPAAIADLAAALHHAERAVELDPDSPASHANLAQVFTVQRKAEDALRHALRAVELGPRRPELRFTLAKALMLNKRYSEAAQQLLEGRRLQNARRRGN